MPINEWDEDAVMEVLAIIVIGLFFLFLIGLVVFYYFL
jgi:hypothetical protein